MTPTTTRQRIAYAVGLWRRSAVSRLAKPNGVYHRVNGIAQGFFRIT
jgi:hypothetical protein